MRNFLVLMLSSLLILSLFPSRALAAGPWKAQIVDAETGEPLEGVVVLAYWIRYTRGWAGWAGGTFYDAEEVVTGPDGRFVIPRRTIINWLPFFTEIRGPELVIFKPGYGSGRIRDWEKLPAEWEELSAGEVLEKEGIIIELPPLKTREERLKFYDSLRWSAHVPPERTRRLEEAVRMERAYLGFRN